MPEAAATRQAQRRDFVVVSTTPFFLAFALNFMLVFLPFYVHRISTLGEDATLPWLGLIMGAAPASTWETARRRIGQAEAVTPVRACSRCVFRLAALPDF